MISPVAFEPSGLRVYLSLRDKGPRALWRLIVTVSRLGAFRPLPRASGDHLVWFRAFELSSLWKPFGTVSRLSNPCAFAPVGLWALGLSGERLVEFRAFGPWRLQACVRSVRLFDEF